MSDNIQPVAIPPPLSDIKPSITKAASKPPDAATDTKAQVNKSMPKAATKASSINVPVAIVATLIIFMVIAGLTTYAYLKSN